MSSESTICLVKDFPITRSDTSVYATRFSWSGSRDDIAKSSQLRSLADYIQELKKYNSYKTLAFWCNSANKCCIWLWDGFPQRLCSILPKPFLQIQIKEKIPTTNAVDTIILEVRLDLTNIVKNSETDNWIAPFSHALTTTTISTTNNKADVILGWDGLPTNPITSTPTSTRIDFECFILNLFEKDSSKDLTIVAGNGTEIKCHRMVFEAHSDVLSAMISPNSGMQESKNGRIKMVENSEEGLAHLIRYLYGIELKIEELSCDVAIELFKTAHKYKLTGLLKWFGAILLEKGSDWFTPDDLLELYFHVKNLAEFKPIEDYTLSIMLGLSKEIRSCERLKELKRTDPDAAFGLMSVLFDLLALQK